MSFMTIKSFKGKTIPVKDGLTPQALKLLLRLVNTGSVTQREAMIDHSIQSLTKRIHELRGAGYMIDTENRKHPITGQRYARYHFVGAV